MKKNILYSLLISTVATVGLSSCDAFLEENPKDQITEEQAYQNSTLLYLNTVASLYTEVGDNGGGSGLQGTDRGLYDLNTFTTDEAVLPTRGGDWYDGGLWQDVFLHKWGTKNDLVKGSWDYLYRVIAQANKSLDKLNEIFESKLIYINNNDNLGIATALNQACDKAIELKFKWILTMDQDSSFINFEHYKKCLEKVQNVNNVALLAANTDKEGYSNFDKNGCSCNYREDKFSVITSANIVNLEYFEEIGRFNDKLFIDMVDYDYCLRINIKKFKILYFPDVFVEHKLGEVHLRTNIFTRKKKYKTEHNAQRAYYISRNSLYLSKNYGKYFSRICSQTTWKPVKSL